MKELLKKYLKKPLPSSRLSYSQLGEDLVIDFIFEQHQIHQPFYIDIGSNDPVRYSNSYYFYRKGGKGICVEPNPDLVAKHKRVRPEDTIVQAGISTTVSGKADYYVMDWHEFNTFDKEQAFQVEKNYQGRNNVKQVLQMPLITPEELILNYVGQQKIDMLSLDVEGYDLGILKSWDFKKHRPFLICVEVFDPRIKQENTEINKLLISHNYSRIAHNPINGIFVSNE